MKSIIVPTSWACYNNPDEMLGTIKDILSNKTIPNEIKVRTKNIYGILNLGTDKKVINELTKNGISVK